MYKQVDYLKVLIVGDATSGKSSLRKAFLQSNMDSNMNKLYEMTIEPEIYNKSLDVGNRNISFLIIDCPGNSLLFPILHEYFSKDQIDAIILVYDRTSPEYTYSLKKWTKWVDDHYPNKTRTKSDLLLDKSRTDSIDETKIDKETYFRISTNHSKTEINPTKQIFESIAKQFFNIH